MKLVSAISLFCCSLLWGTSPLEQWDASAYAQNSSVQTSHFERFFDLNTLFGCKRILDVGSGDGKLSAKIAGFAKQAEVVGIDCSYEMVKYASSQYPYKNLHFEQQLAQNFHFDTPFDYIVSIHTLHWIKEQEESLRNIYNHLVPGGRAFFISAPSKEGLPFDEALKKTSAHWKKELQGFVSNQTSYDLETYRKLLLQAGFHIEAIHYVFTEFPHENKETLGAWLKQWLPQYKALSPTVKELFLEELINNYLLCSGQVNKVSPLLWGEYVLIARVSKPLI